MQAPKQLESIRHDAVEPAGHETHGVRLQHRVAARSAGAEVVVKSNAKGAGLGAGGDYEACLKVACQFMERYKCHGRAEVAVPLYPTSTPRACQAAP